MRAGVTPERWDRRDARLQIMRAAHAQLPRSEETGGRERRDLARAAFEPGEPEGDGPRGGRRRVPRSDVKLCIYGRTVDALAPAAEEGRGHAAKCAGEGLAPGDPAISEWGNPAAVMGRHCA
jgi:hypothetical protein